MLIRLLGLAFVALACVIYAEISAIATGDALEYSDAAPLNLPAPMSSPPLFVMPDREALAAILERPVFSETRRPSENPTGIRATQADFTLAGVVIAAGERSALIQLRDGRLVQRLKEGDDVAGWRLVEIARDRIRIRRGVVEAEMLIDYAAPAPLIPRTESRRQKLALKPAAQEQAKQPSNQLQNAEPQPEEETQH
jgi:hypothetical protein